MIYWLKLPALVTSKLAESGVVTEGVLVDSVQKDGADVEVLEVLGTTEHVSLHRPQVAAKIENAEAVHSLKAGDLQPEGAAAHKDGPALEGEVKRVDERSSNSWRNSSQLILGEVEVFQNIKLFEKLLIDDSDQASPEDEVLEVGTHAWEVIVGVAKDGEDVSGKVEPLDCAPNGHVDPNGHQIQIIIAHAQAGELSTGDTTQGKAYRGPVQTWL